MCPGPRHTYIAGHVHTLALAKRQPFGPAIFLPVVVGEALVPVRGELDGEARWVAIPEPLVLGGVQDPLHDGSPQERVYATLGLVTEVGQPLLGSSGHRCLLRRPRGALRGFWADGKSRGKSTQ